MILGQCKTPTLHKQFAITGYSGEHFDIAKSVVALETRLFGSFTPSFLAMWRQRRPATVRVEGAPAPAHGEGTWIDFDLAAATRYTWPR